MPIHPHLRQPQNDLVVVGGWQPDEDNPVGPQGAKPKRQIFCPEVAPRGYLYGGHRYLFKEPPVPWSQQVWSEVIAYELAKLAGVPVPPAFLAFDEQRNVPGVLVEFFFGHPGEQPPLRFFQGTDRLQAHGRPIGERHGSLRDNIAVCRLLRIPNAREWWSQTITFDSVIGNTDRHSANWGVLVDFTGEEPHYSMAPAFDNGTSLGYIVRDQDLGAYSEKERLNSFLDRGRHHFDWLPGSAQGALFPALCQQFVAVYGPPGPATMAVIHLRDSDIDDVLQWCTRFDFPVPFTPQRAEFVSALIKARRNATARAMGV